MNKLFTLKTTLTALAGLAVVLAAPEPASAQESGAEVWGRTCARCHRMQPPSKYDARHWEAIMGHMALNARLTSDEEDAVREFLMAAARRIASEQPSTEPSVVAEMAARDLAVVAASLQVDGKEVYDGQCAACHGKSGEGDGPAAMVFDPKPTDLTDADYMGTLTREALLKVLADGKGDMPGYSALLSQEELEALAEYVRSLSKDDGS